MGRVDTFDYVIVGVLPCVCGLKLKLPPDLKHDKVTCPKCSREHEVPIAQLAAAAAIADNLPGEWMTFKCTCGATKTLSPSFAAKKMKCKKCGRTIKIA